MKILGHQDRLDVFGNDTFGTMLADGVHKATLSLKHPAPKLLFHFGTSFANFSGYDAFHHSDNPCYTVRWKAPNQKMNVVIVSTDLQKPNFISFFNLGACPHQSLIDPIGNHDLTVFRTTDQMVQKHSNVMTLMYKFTV